MSVRDNAWQMAAALSKNEISAVELANQHYEQIQAVDKDVHAFLHLDKEGALSQAKEVDKKRAACRCTSCVKGCNDTKGCANNLWLKDFRKLAPPL
ncbi:MAG: hypothetical protein RLZZ27_687 [Actinomycetota bacterium]